MTSLPKAMRRAVLTAKTLATAIAPEFKRTPLATGGAAKYPLAPTSEWYGDANYKDTGGRLQWMHPDEFLGSARPLDIDETSRDNIEDLKRHIKSGKTLDPLHISPAGKEDGRHRAHAAKELGIKKVPVLTWPKTAKAAGGAVDGDDAPDDDSPYYSPLAQGLKGAKLETGPAAYWKNTISKLPGAAEAKDTGLHDFIDSQGGDIQKQALLEHLAMNSPQLQEHWFEEDPKRKLHENRPRFTDHTLDGGTNHKELSINLPSRVPAAVAPSDRHDFISPTGHRYMTGDGAFHPADVNRIAHVRMNDRRGPKGEKLLHIDELQSDWGQSLRKQRELISSHLEGNFDHVVSRMVDDGVIKKECD